MNRYFMVGFATLLLVAGMAFLSHGSGFEARAIAQEPTATSTGAATLGPTAVSTPTPGATATVAPASTTAPTATAAAMLPDLTLSISASPDPVMAGQILSYVVVVSNEGTGASPQAWLTGQLPQGTSVQTLATGCVSDAALGTLRCQVGGLSAGQEATFILHLNVTATGGTIGNRFSVDPEGLVIESDETNNVVDKIVLVAATTAVATATVAPSPTTAAVATAAPAPTEVPVATPAPAPVPPPPPPPPPAGQLWVEILAATPVYSAAGDVLWEAQPGEWYWVISQDADWVLAAWEQDPPEAAAWIQIDGRVSLAVF